MSFNVTANVEEIEVPEDADDLLFTVEHDLNAIVGISYDAHTSIKNSLGNSVRVYDVSTTSRGSVAVTEEQIRVTGVIIPGHIDNSNPFFVSKAFTYQEPTSQGASLVVKRRDNKNNNFHYDVFFNFTTPGTNQTLDLYVFEYSEPPGDIDPIPTVSTGIQFTTTVIRTIGGNTVYNLFVVVNSPESK